MTDNRMILSQYDNSLFWVAVVVCIIAYAIFRSGNNNTPNTSAHGA